MWRFEVIPHTQDGTNIMKSLVVETGHEGDVHDSMGQKPNHKLQDQGEVTLGGEEETSGVSSGSPPSF